MLEALFVCLAIHDCKDDKQDGEQEEVRRVHVLENLVLGVGEGGRGDESAEDGLAPVVVQESEVALDGFQTELLESQDDTKEQEVKVHNGVMHVLQLHNSETKGSHSDKRDRAAEEQVFAHQLEGALVLLSLGGFPSLLLAHLGVRTILLFIGRVIFQVGGHVVAVPWTSISLLQLLSLLL